MRGIIEKPIYCQPELAAELRAEQFTKHHLGSQEPPEIKKPAAKIQVLVNRNHHRENPLKEIGPGGAS